MCLYLNNSEDFPCWTSSQLPPSSEIHCNLLILREIRWICPWYKTWGGKRREIEWSRPHQLSSPFWPCSAGKGPRLAHRGDSPHFLWGFGKKQAANAASQCSQSCCERPGKESRGRGRSIINHRSQPTPEMVGAPNPGSSTIDWIKFLNEPAAVGRHVAERTDWGHPVCCPATGNLTL